MHNPFSEFNLALNSCYPTPKQQLLLQAALWQGEPAIEAWQQWQVNTQLETLDPGSYRMLPLLYHNLHLHGIQHPFLSKMKGVYRHTWARNQLLLHRITEVLSLLQQAQIPTLLLKGAALLTLYYQHQGLRPMSDFDLLVPKAKVLEAIETLQALDWLPEGVLNLSSRHAHLFKNQDQELDLHWSFIPESVAHPQAEDIWQQAISCPLPALALSPTDQLFHICVHGFQWNPLPSLRWVADAIVLLNHQPQLDWERCIDLAIRYQLVLPLRGSFQFLVDRMNCPHLTEPLNRLNALPITDQNRLDYYCRTQEFKLVNFYIAKSPIVILKLYYDRCKQYSQSHSLYPLTMIKSLQTQWHLKSPWQVPLLIFYKIIRVLIMLIYGFCIRAFWKTFSVLRINPKTNLLNSDSKPVSSGFVGRSK